MDHTPLGARALGNGETRFRVWVPDADHVSLVLLGDPERTVPMVPEGRGYHVLTVGADPGTLYLYELQGGLRRPDPASHFQPEGVDGPSAVVDHTTFSWNDRPWYGLPLRDYVIYEMHVGTFTEEGTFDAVIDHLDELRDLGVTAIEAMPVAQFPGARNWGYDGVFPYAPQDSYGGPAGLRRLVDACHRRGMAFVLDVVYNHLGPEGCYLDDFGPYFTDRYHTPWGRALNFDGAGSDEVRSFFIGNALSWFEDYHVDALRLDAVHAILDTSALPFLEELAIETSELSERLNRRLHLIAESADNDARIIAPRALGGFGLDAQWNDDFHHALYALVTGERTGHYADYGSLSHLARAMRDGYVYQGEYSRYRRRRHGRSSRHRGAERFVVFSRNHDQIGNRMLGDRLTTRISFEEMKLAAGALLLSPYIPLLFMGEEYGETAPFRYFVSHSDPDLVEAIRRGRAEDFAGFGWEGEPPDPQAEETFTASKIDRTLRTKGDHARLWDYYRELLRLRSDIPALGGGKEEMAVSYDERSGLLALHRWSSGDEVVVLLHFGPEEVEVPFPEPRGTWNLIADSTDERWAGPGSQSPALLDATGEHALRLPPASLLVYRREGTWTGEVT